MAVQQILEKLKSLKSKKDMSRDAYFVGKGNKALHFPNRGIDEEIK